MASTELLNTIDPKIAHLLTSSNKPNLSLLSRGKGDVEGWIGIMPQISRMLLEYGRPSVGQEPINLHPSRKLEIPLDSRKIIVMQAHFEPQTVMIPASNKQFMKEVPITLLPEDEEAQLFLIGTDAWKDERGRQMYLRIESTGQMGKRKINRPTIRLVKAVLDIGTEYLEGLGHHS